ncbi:LysE family transporter [Cytobacillus suaedae]|nr:LysE family transporter [Cytobacillus suaedae]
MLELCLKYLFLGVTLAITLGPVNFELIKQGVTKGFFSSWLVGLGAASADIMIVFIICFGLGHLFLSETVQPLLGILGAIMLVFMGYQNIKSRKKHVSETSDEKGVSDTKRKNTYFTGYLLAIANPLNIVFWTGIYGTLTLETTSVGSTFVLFLFIFLGIIISNIIMSFMSSLGKSFFKPKYLQGISVFSGIVLIFYGVWIAYTSSISVV